MQKCGWHSTGLVCVRRHVVGVGHCLLSAKLLVLAGCIAVEGVATDAHLQAQGRMWGRLGIVLTALDGSGQCVLPRWLGHKCRCAS